MKNSFQLKAFLTFLSRNKLYTAVNIFGFAVSLMFVILLGVYTLREYSVDQFHENKERIFRLEHETGSILSAAIPPYLESRYPEIEASTRLFQQTYKVEVPGKAEAKYQEDILLADSTFFTMFSFPFVEGNPVAAMPTKQQVVLTESFARKLFGNQPAMGQAIKVDGRDFTVNGVVRDFKNTHFKNPAMVISFVNLADFWGYPGLLTEFNNNSFTIYLMTKPGADLRAKLPDMEKYLRDDLNHWMFSQGRTKNLNLVPLPEIYFKPSESAYFATGNNQTYLAILGVTALLILVFAMINYINLSVAQTGFRAKEAAMRRLLGGSRGQLFWNFITESMLLCAFSFLLGLGLAQAAEPLFQQMMNTQVALTDGMTWANLGIAVAGVLVLGMIAGTIPAVVVTRFQPIDVVRGTFRRKTKMVYSKVLISFQYCITIALIGCTITIISQVRYMQNADMGYATHQVIVAQNICSPEEEAGFRDRLMAIPGVERVSFSQGVPPSMVNNNSWRDKNDVNHSVSTYTADSVFMQIMRFDTVYSTGLKGFWVNETMAKKSELPADAVEVEVYGKLRPLAGILRDFHTGGFSEEIGEAMIAPMGWQGNGWAWTTVIETSGGDPFETFRRVEELFNEKAGGNFFQGEFLDQTVAKLYEEQKRMTQVLGSLSLIAIVISALGMLAMATYFIRQRTQEVAVRKVFGSTRKQVLVRLMGNFLWLVGIAFVVAVPVIAYLMREWLSGYPYRIPLSWTIFAGAGLLALAIASLTVLWQSLRAASTNPVKSLKSE